MGETIAVFFITVLLHFTTLPEGVGQPNEGWLQWAFPFPNEEACEAFLIQNMDEFVALTLKRFRALPLEIKEIDCLTYNEALKRNTILGHIGDSVTPQDQPTKPLLPKVPSA